MPAGAPAAAGGATLHADNVRFANAGAVDAASAEATLYRPFAAPLRVSLPTRVDIEGERVLILVEAG